MNTNTINECKTLSLSGKMTFPEVVKKLLEAGVERYYVDLINLENTYYGNNDEIYRCELILEEKKKIDNRFSEPLVGETIRQIQRGEIDYLEFLQRIMKAGVVYYTVFLKGKQVFYGGREGELWIEKFPQ